MSGLKLAILERDLSTSKQSYIKHILFAKSNIKEINYMAFFEVTAILYLNTIGKINISQIIKTSIWRGIRYNQAERKT
jgi:hypothetical protein